jgi:hypothetical protein
VAVSKDGGLTWEDKVVLKVDGTKTLGNLFPGLNYVDDGNLYALGALADTASSTADHAAAAGIVYSVSTDDGATWSDMHRVNAGTGATVFPTAVGGSGGVLDVAWIESTKSDQLDENADWSVRFAQVRDADTDNPVSTEVKGPIVRHGVVCTLGILCHGGRDLGDFMEVALDSFGYAHAAVTSTQGATHITYWRQDAGPSAYTEPCSGKKAAQCTPVTVRPGPGS